ncbi:MAG: hypothetical protein LBN30_02350 [Oscillospiraceae bacterium]|jgi:histone H3/H4|nr:hypothetical protein [Oscillospiraceae bacterium]
MATFDEIKRKIKATAGVIADAAVETYKVAEEKSKVLAKTTKLSAENAGDRNVIRKLYADIGKLYYEKYSTDAEGEFAPPVGEINDALERIALRDKEIAALKSTADITDEEVYYADDAETAEVEPEAEASDDAPAE